MRRKIKFFLSMEIDALFFLFVVVYINSKMVSKEFKTMALAAFVGAFLIPTIIVLIFSLILYILAALLGSGSNTTTTPTK